MIHAFPNGAGTTPGDRKVGSFEDRKLREPMNRWMLGACAPACSDWKNGPHAMSSCQSGLREKQSSTAMTYRLAMRNLVMESSAPAPWRFDSETWILSNPLMVLRLQ